MAFDSLKKYGGRRVPGLCDALEALSVRVAQLVKPTAHKMIIDQRTGVLDELELCLMYLATTY